MVSKVELKHAYLSLETMKAKNKLENKYHKAGFPSAKVYIEICFIVFLLTGCICTGERPPTIEETPPPIIIDGTKIPAVTVETSKLHPTVAPTTSSTLPTVYRNVIRYIDMNLTRNISAIQEFNLKNMRPDNCGSSACSDGYFKCKYEALNFLDIDNPFKFNQRTARETYNRDYPDIWLPVRWDNWTYLIELNKSMWYLEANKEKWIIRKV